MPGRKPDSEAGCIFENSLRNRVNSLKTLAAGTRDHRVLFPPPGGQTYKMVEVGERRNVDFLRIGLKKITIPRNARFNMTAEEYEEITAKTDGACPPPPNSKSQFQTWNFPKRGMSGSSKDSRQNSHLRRNTQGNLPAFHLEFMSVYVAALLF